MTKLRKYTFKIQEKFTNLRIFDRKGEIKRN